MEDEFDALLKQMKNINFEKFKPVKCELSFDSSSIDDLLRKIFKIISFEYNQDHVNWGHYLFTSRQKRITHIFICFFTSLAIRMDDIVDCESKGNFYIRKFSFHKKE